MENQLLYLYFGGGIQLLLFLFYKILKNNKIYWTIFSITSIIAILGFAKIDDLKLKMVNGNAATWLFLPLLFLIYFSLLRFVFLEIYKNEPIMAGFRASSWEQGEYRKLHLGDSFFTILTLILPFLTILIFGKFL